jgi:L-glutamate---[L-glutamyl-carrier protein] ligase
MSESLTIGLPNGKRCYITSDTMRTIAKYLRWETFKQGQYTKAGFELRAGDTVVDIGANIGMFALWAEPQIPRGRLICIEPNPRVLECLRLNISRNGLNNVAVVPVAAGATDGTMELVCHPGWEALAYSTAVDAPWFFNKSRAGRVVRWMMQRLLRQSHQTAAQKPFAVPQMPLARIMDEHAVTTIDFLKVDCEGSEYEILRSLDAAHWARIERIVIEYHEFGRDRSHRELVRLLEDNGFEVERVRTLLTRLFGLTGASVGMIWARKPERNAAPA